MAGTKGKADRTHRPSGPEHYPPNSNRRINRRAIACLTRETGVSSQLAKAIINVPVTHVPSKVTVNA